MRVLAPRDNAPFLRYWRPAVRPTKLVPFVVLLVVVLAVIVFGCYLARAQRPGREPSWFVVAFAITTGVQALIVLLIGSYLVGSATCEEATTGAIDFHRASATTPLNQVLGLVLGPAMLTWILFAVSIPVTLACAALGAVTMGDYVSIQASLVLTGVFFHVLAALIGLTGTKGRLSARQQAGAVAAALALIGISIPFSYSDWSLPSYLTSYPVIGRALGGEKHINSALLGVKLPPLLVQAIVQCPLIVLLGAALRRAVAYPGRPPISKLLGLALAACLFALFALSFLTGLAVGPLESAEYALVSSVALVFAFALGAALVGAATPRHVLYCNGLRRRRKLGLKRPLPLDDASGNGCWAVAFGLLTTAFYFSLTGGLPLESLAAMLLYFGWFAGAAEYFRLSPEKRRGAIFAVTVAILWALIPAVGFIAMVAESRWLPWAIYLVSTCPVFGIVAPSIGRSGAEDTPPQPDTTIIILAINAVLLIVFALLARSARARAARNALELVT